MKKSGVGALFVCLLLAIPFSCVAWGGLAWIQYGLDFPWYDDWRGYQSGNIESLRLKYLFSPINDTLSPVGLALDAIFQIIIFGNSIVYQLISMSVVLISLLILQLGMLRRVLVSNQQVAICFLFTLPMLQPGSYWGAQNLAYHQVLPLLFLLIAIWIIFFSRIHDCAKYLILNILGFLAGFTYVSGAFAFLTAGLVLIVISTKLTGDAKRNIFYSSMPLLFSGGVTSLIQLIFAFDSFGSTHSQVSIAYPTQLNYWLYLLGKVGRGLLLSNRYPWIAFVTTIIVVAAIFFLVIVVVKKITSIDRDDAEKYKAELIFLVLFIVLGAYIMIVAAGRANYYSKQSDWSLAAFISGFERFHFFWLTVLWPWVVAALISNSSRISAIIKGPLFYVVAIVCLATMNFSNVWHHGTWHQMALEIRKPVFDCFVRSITDGKAILCEKLLPYRGEDGLRDATPAYLHAIKIGASFLRYMPRIDDLKRSKELVPFLRLAGTSNQFLYEGLAKSEDGSLAVIDDFPKIYIRDLPHEALRKCARMDVVIHSSAEGGGYFQLFFRESNDLYYQEIFSKKAAVVFGGNVLGEAEFRLISRSGFASELRLDPGKNLKKFNINNIEFYCVIGELWRNE